MMKNLPAMKNQLWLKSLSVSEYISNIICELKIVDRIEFKKTFRMSSEDFEFVLKHRNHITFPFPTRIKQCCSKQCYSISLKIYDVIDDGM